jgi:hypothetical protein
LRRAISYLLTNTRIFDMNRIKIIVLLSAIFLIPGTIFAKDADDGEKIYVVYQQNRIPIPVDELKNLCDPEEWLFGGQPVFAGSRADLYSVHTKKTDGSILKDDLKKVGSLVGCQSALQPVLERGAFPTLDGGLVIYLTLNGNQYMVTGSNRLRTNPVFGFPEPGQFLSGSTGTIQKPFTLADFPNNIEVVGSISINTISAFTGGNLDDSSSIYTLRLYGQ